MLFIRYTKILITLKYNSINCGISVFQFRQCDQIKYGNTYNSEAQLTHMNIYIYKNLRGRPPTWRSLDCQHGVRTVYLDKVFR